MSFLNNFDLNLSPSSDQLSGEEQVNLFDLDRNLEDVSNEENLNQLQTNPVRNIDLNELPLDNSEEDELQNEPDSSLGESGRSVPKKLKVLSNEERKEIYLILLGSKNVTGKLRKGTIGNVSRMFSVSTRTVSRIWRQAKRSTNPGLADVSHKKTKNCGRKRIEIDPEQFKKIPLSRRTSLESLACAIKISRSTLHRRVRGANTYKIPHISKGSLERENKLPIQIQCDVELIEDATQWLNLPENV
ncbi:hypothetical protein POM88_031133 [Heracleum sosnowskyi]|uniref:DUF7769 domain-containing protein n=1 Tax=Heracleum sosnowskyi TaxID=360622 RepID=A0AAD8MGC8_9APIA|nr:hypothetical protein POM88_031133 [Heracleum sosnowskyi]